MFRKNPNLIYRTRFPQRITESRLALSPLPLVGGTGSAVLLGGLGEASVLADFDREIVGGLELSLTASAPAHIRIDYEEDAELAKRREPLACSWYTLVTDEYDVEAGDHVLVSQGRRGFRFVNISVTSEENVRINQIKAIDGTWNFKERGSFRCSDDRLNRIWDISAATTKACMQDFYEDGVKRDGLLWLGDYRITFLCAYYLTGDLALARKCLMMMRDSQYECGAIPACAARGGGEQHHRDDGIAYMPRIPGDGQNRWVILNYMCDYIKGIDEYIRMTGDESILPEIMESAEKAMDYLISLTDLETPGKWYIDDYKAKRDENGMNFTILIDCTMNPKNCFESYGALLFELIIASDALIRLANKSGNTALAERTAVTRARLEEHIETHYKEPTHGQYTDRKRQKFCDISQYVTPQVILAGKDEEIGMERMMRSVMPNLGFSQAWRLEAMFKKGYTAEALRDIRSTWGKMLDYDSRTCWERLDVPEMNATHYYDAIGSFCHGWGASPAWQLPAWITGVQPTDDGFKTLRIAPALDTLDWAEASVPTPHGDLLVRVERKGRRQTLIAVIPTGVENCTVVWEDGQTQRLSGGGKYVLTH